MLNKKYHFWDTEHYEKLNRNQSLDAYEWPKWHEQPQSLLQHLFYIPPGGGLTEALFVLYEIPSSAASVWMSWQHDTAALTKPDTEAVTLTVTWNRNR